MNFKERETAHAAERRIIQDAMQRVLSGATGRPSISALAAEAGFRKNRQALYDRHPDLLAEFRTLAGQPPPADATTQTLQAQLTRAQQRNTELEAEVTALTAKLRTLTSILAELSVEAETPTPATPIRTRRPRR